MNIKLASHALVGLMLLQVPMCSDMPELPTNPFDQPSTGSGSGGGSGGGSRPRPQPVASTPCSRLEAAMVNGRVSYSGECHSGSWASYSTSGTPGRSSITIRQQSGGRGVHVCGNDGGADADGYACRARDGRTEGVNYEWVYVGG